MLTNPTTPSRRRRLIATPLAVVLALGAGGVLTACQPVPTTCHGLTATITGTAGSDNILGTPTRDVIVGLGGDDTLQGVGGSDVICGGAGDDLIVGGLQGDVLDGEAGFDLVDGGLDGDQIHDRGGAPGETNRFVGGHGDDRFTGGAGRDLISYAGSPEPVEIDLLARTAIGDGRDQLFGSIEGVIGSRYPDTLAGDDRANSLDGGEGDDRVVGRGGNDNLIGGAGGDDVSYTDAPGPVTVNLATRRATGDGSDGVTGFESINGSAHDDVLTGDPGPNFISGGDGLDLCAGGGGRDTFASCP